MTQTNNAIQLSRVRDFSGTCLSSLRPGDGKRWANQQTCVMPVYTQKSIPEAQVRLFGSRVKGTARPDSDVDLLITVPDHWLAERDRIRVLGALWRQFSSHRLPLDLLLYSESEVNQRKQYRSAVTTQAYQD